MSNRKRIIMHPVESQKTRKLRGGYYTPEQIAAFILKWGTDNNSNCDILEPSCGDGEFLKQMIKNGNKFKSLTAIELDVLEAKKAGEVDLPNTTVINTDFHLYCNETKDRFDLIIGNPPYIRCQYFNKDQQVEAEKIFKKANLKYSKLTNAWVSFVVGSSLLLKEQGKIGFVVPAELLQVSYAKQLREFLSRFYNKINIISFKKLVFPDIQQEVILLLCEKNTSSFHLIEHLEVEDASDLLGLDLNKLKSPKKTVNFMLNKWTYYFLEQEEIDFLESVVEKKEMPTLGDFANIEVGITTGANNYFTVPSSTVTSYQIGEFAKPMVGRGVQVNSVIFSKDDWLKNNQSEVKSNLLVFPSKDNLHDHVGAQRYIHYGESIGVNRGYKTGIRDDWFVIPSVKLSDAFFTRRGNMYPRLILNEANAYTTDTMHRVFAKESTNLNALIASFYNSLSLAFSEIVGRSYGGGVLELMPREAEQILLPYCTDNEFLLAEIDEMMRKRKNIDEILHVNQLEI